MKKHGNRFIDLTGHCFGRLIARKEAVGRKHGKVLWDCDCDCGNPCVVSSGNLRSGKTRSCGCFKRDLMSELGKTRRTHGHARHGYKSSTYGSWESMLARCRNPNAGNFSRYGGRGVRVCKRWKKFEHFLADLGEKPKGTTLGRFNDTGNYEPGNVAWQSWREQGQAKRNKYALLKAA